MSSPSRNNFLLRVAYDGTGFSGWQKQPGKRTVQGELEKAAAKVAGRPARATAAGRTDSGVHARGQAVSISLGRPLQPSRLREALNALLPSDISVSSAKAVPASFNARYAAIAKTYEYRIWNKPYRSVWNQGYSWHIIRPLDLASMRKATSCLLGKCDFSAFDGAGGTQPNKNVNMRRIRISRTAGMVKVVLTADRFLHKMVRNIAGTLVEVGLGRRAPESLRTVLSGRKRVAAGRTAPAQGLFLTTVHYKKG